MKATKIQRERQSTADMNPAHSWLQQSHPNYRGCRTKYAITHNPSMARPGEEIYVSLGALGSTQPIDPNSICLKYVFNRTDPESKLYNNLSANLVQRLIISVGGETIYDNSWENLLRTYSDLWLSQRAREELTEFGVCTEPLRNASEKSCKVTRTLANLFRHQKILLGKIISDQGMMLPSCMHHNLSFTLVLADATCVLSKGSYTLTALEIEYDVLTSPSLRTLINRQYDMGKSLPFRGVSWLHQTIWGKDQMLVNENVNVSKNQIIMLFTKKSGRHGSEEFVFPGISEVNVTVKGIPGSVYNSGMKTVDLLTVRHLQGI